MRVLSNYIIIEESVVDHKESMTGLITTADNASKMRYHEGLVMHVGPEVKYVIVGVNIMFDKAQGHHITIDDKTYRIFREQDVAVVL